MLGRNLQALLLTTALTVAPYVPAYALPAEPDSAELMNLSLEELSNVLVTSVSKKVEPENEAAAAIYVITQDDIRRSGATAIPELPRMAPGLTVTRAGSHNWTVTARGSNGQFSNKLLVLIDGRTIYSPLFSGVIWDVQDTMLEDIDRIEVIRGPGATLWGANAVNGVINIITKDSQKTQGGLAVATAGNKVTGIGAVRYGGKISQDSYLRTYAKYTDYDSEETPSGISANDNWYKKQAGFRSDSKVSDTDKLTVQGDLYTINEDANYTIPDITSGTLSAQAEGIKARGGNVLARWEHENSKDSQLSLQVYLDNTKYTTSFFNDTTNTADVDFQHVWTAWNGHEIVWGTGYRFIKSENEPPSVQYSLSPQSRSDNLFNAFVQDKIALVPNNLYLTLGSKFEHNDYSGVEIQPSAKMTWLPTENQTLWASVSRAIHTPNRFTDDGTQSLGIIPPNVAVPIPTLLVNVGNRDLEAEELISYEIGYKVQPTKSTSIDATAFYNDYSNHFSAALGTPIITSYVYQPVITVNGNEAKAVGYELSGKWNIMSNWQTAASYSYISEVYKNKGDFAFPLVGRNPKNQFNIRSTYLFPYGIEMTNLLYYVDELHGVGVPSYYRFDTKLSYEVMEGLELSLVGQNLLDSQHQEFSPFFYRSTAAEIGRSVYGSVAFKF